MTCFEIHYVKRYICGECGKRSTAFSDLTSELRSIQTFLPDGHAFDGKECTGPVVFVIERITSIYRLMKNGLHPDGVKPWIRGGLSDSLPIPEYEYVYQRQLGFAAATFRWYTLKEDA